MRIGSDTGGTFTDLVGPDGRTAKVPSTPDDPGRAVRAALDEFVDGAGRGRVELLAHGTTVATNALIERSGARVALVTNEGLADIIEIARQDRPSLYDQGVDRPDPVVARRRRFEVRGRLAADGSELVPLDLSTLPDLDPDIEAVAVCLLHADLNSSHERAVAAELRARGFDVTASHEISPEFREYERTVTTAVNAYLRPRCRAYLEGLIDVAAGVATMTSAGGLVPAKVGAEHPARLLLSGPAGGVAAGAALAAANGFPDCITFDMGGTSTDVCLVLDGRPEPAAEREVAGLPVRLPSLDVHTIGAGGGSIAWIDRGGALCVGPESAGAVPGPACYGRGGTRPTVTDADLALGRIPEGAPFPGLGTLDVTAARTALAGAGIDAGGVVEVVDAHMEQALRRVSVERGIDPSGLGLVAFGGAGPLHACHLAESLGMAAVLVPPRAGVLSAVGILCAPVQVDVIESWARPLDHAGVAERLALMASAASAEAVRDSTGAGDAPSLPPEVITAVDCRYLGQSHELRVPSVRDFEAEHERRNGYRRPGHPVEVMALRASARVPAPVAVDDLPPVERPVVHGPAVVAEADCTIFVPDGWSSRLGAGGVLILEPRARGAIRRWPRTGR